MESKTGSNRCIAIYDLSCNPITYDFASFLFCADSHFCSCGYDQFEVLIIASKTAVAESATKYKLPYSCDQIEDRIQRLLLPLARHYANCFSTIILPSHADVRQYLARRFFLYPPDYNPILNKSRYTHHDLFKYGKIGILEGGLSISTNHATDALHWLASRNITCKFVVMTCRESVFQPLRNSSANRIKYISQCLNKAGFQVVVVPDTESDAKFKHENQGFYTVCELAAYDMTFRLALYRLSSLCYFDANGPYLLALLTKSIRFIINNYNPYWTIDELAAAGIKYGEQPFTTDKVGKRRGEWLWDPVTDEQLMETIREFLDI